MHVGSSDATMIFFSPSSCKSSAYRASSGSALSRPSQRRTNSISSVTARSTISCVSASRAWYSAPAGAPWGKSARVGSLSSSQLKRGKPLIGSLERSVSHFQVSSTTTSHDRPLSEKYSQLLARARLTFGMSLTRHTRWVRDAGAGAGCGVQEWCYWAKPVLYSCGDTSDTVYDTKSI